MTKPLHEINMETCRGDGVCVEVCPEDVLEIADGKAITVDDRAGACILCGQCVAVCPTESLLMPQLPEDDFQDLARASLGHNAFFDFLRSRRSVRVFKDRPVEREVTEKILAAAATAPMGFPPHSTGVVVIDRREELDFLLERLVAEYDTMISRFSNPVGRSMVRLFAGAEDYRVLREKILGLVRYANEAWRRDGTDEYLYGAPALMLFHGDRRAMSYVENAHLVCHHAMLAALSLGLGTTIIGLVPPIVERSRELRERYGIPRGNRVLTSLILGYPKYRYRKGIRRDLAGVHFA
jgi:nitroreductase/NAD-dependent dihydropyrimidine dehydrogenase PreA subunit